MSPCHANTNIINNKGIHCFVAYSLRVTTFINICNKILSSFKRPEYNRQQYIQ